MIGREPVFSTWYGRTQGLKTIRLYKRIAQQWQSITPPKKVAHELSKGISYLHTQHHNHAQFKDKIYILAYSIFLLFSHQTLYFRIAHTYTYTNTYIHTPTSKHRHTHTNAHLQKKKTNKETKTRGGWGKGLRHWHGYQTAPTPHAFFFFPVFDFCFVCLFVSVIPHHHPLNHVMLKCTFSFEYVF